MSEWTPGPWQVAQDSDCVYAGDHEEMAHMVGPANARLIAAAPEMAELLAAIAEHGSAFASAIELDEPTPYTSIDGEHWMADVVALLARINGAEVDA